MPQEHRDFVRTGVLLGLGLIGAGLVSCSSLQRTVVVAPEIEGASFVGNKACLECHAQYVKVFASTPHARIHLDSPNAAGLTGCESCHGPGSKHIAAGGGRGRFIVNPGKEPAACFHCHLEIRAQFNLPHRHPVLEGRLNCVQCHDPHGLEIMKPAGRVGNARAEENCSECHREQTKPVVFPHEALREGCGACHEPHGSVNTKMLRQPDLNLCLRCHAQVQGPGVPAGQVVIGAINHSTFVSRGACWTSGCHTAVHGSDVNHHFLY